MSKENERITATPINNQVMYQPLMQNEIMNQILINYMAQHQNHQQTNTNNSFAQHS